MSLQSPFESVMTSTGSPNENTYAPAPKVTILQQTAYKKSSWKNGLGETQEVAVYPPTTRDFRKADFAWRLSISSVKDSCTFSVFPGYDVHLMVLPEHTKLQSHSRSPVINSADVDEFDQNLSIKNLTTSATYLSPAVLRHNDHEKPVPIKPLLPYCYSGEQPTSCTLSHGPIKYLSFTSQRDLCSVRAQSYRFKM
jgi:environmental stress-induced protein Ves